MKYSKFKMIVMVGIIANQSFLTNTAQLSGNPTPSRSADSLLVLTTKYVVQKIIADPELFSISEGKLTIEKQDVPLDLLQHIAKYYYLLSGNKLEEKFPSCKPHVVSKGKPPIYGFSFAELTDYKQYPKLPRIEVVESGLNLSNKQLNTLDGITTFPEIERVTWLDLSKNQLISLPEAIGNLTQLQWFFLSHNQLTSLPVGIGNLTQLQGLDLSNNQLTSLPEAIGNLTQLKGLDLSNNRLISLPADIGNLTQLKRLDLYNNRLISLPADIGNLTQLEELDLSHNQLISIPEAIGNLTQLKRLYLSSNKLASLPTDIGNLTQLQGLYLRNNPIHPDTIPTFVETLPEAFRDAILFYKDNNHNTLLHKAAEAGNKTAIDNLILYGLSMNTPNNTNITPQMILDTQPTNMSPEPEPVMSPEPEPVAAKFFLFSFINRLFSAIKNLWTSPNEVNITHQPPVDTTQPPQEPAAAEFSLMKWLLSMIKKLKPSPEPKSTSNTSTDSSL